MAPSAISPQASSSDNTVPTILSLRKTLTSESESLAKRFRALFSLKHLASNPSSPSYNAVASSQAISAIASAFETASALLGHELAYVLGQTKNVLAIPYLKERLLDLQEDAIVRHEAAEALGAIGDLSVLGLLRELRSPEKEKELVVRETCEIAVDRLEWEHSEEGKKEKLKARHVFCHMFREDEKLMCVVVISLLLILRLLWSIQKIYQYSRRHCLTPSFLFSGAIEHYLHYATLLHHQIFLLLSQLS